MSKDVLATVKQNSRDDKIIRLTDFAKDVTFEEAIEEIISYRIKNEKK